MKALANDYPVPESAVLRDRGWVRRRPDLQRAMCDVQAAALEALVHAVEDERLALSRVDDALAATAARQRALSCGRRRAASAAAARPSGRRLAATSIARSPTRWRASRDAETARARRQAIGSRSSRRPALSIATNSIRGSPKSESLGFDPVYDDSVFARQEYVAGPADVRAGGDPCGVARPVDRRRSWPCAVATAARRCCRCSIRPRHGAARKPFIGYSDLTAVLTFLTHELRDGGVSRTDARRTTRARAPKATTATRSSRRCAGASRWASWRRQVSKPFARGEARGHAARRHADAAAGVARHAVRVRRRRRAMCCSSTKSASGRIASIAW